MLTEQFFLTEKPWIPARYVMTMLGFLGFFNLYALRVNLSVAIVAMVDNSEKPADTAVALADSDTCPTMNASSADGKKVCPREFQNLRQLLYNIFDEGEEITFLRLFSSIRKSINQSINQSTSQSVL